MATAAASRARVLIVEDDSLALEELGASIDAADDLEVVATAQSVEQGLRRVSEPHDLLLLDLGLPDGNGLEVLDAQRRHQPDARCLVMTVFDTRDNTIAAVSRGAHGYVLKTAPDLLSHLRAVLEGEHPIDARVAGHVLAEVRGGCQPAADASQGALTPRELETLCGLAEGLSYRRIAERMHVSPNTVPDYIKSLYTKLAVNSRSEAVYIGLRRGLIHV